MWRFIFWLVARVFVFYLHARKKKPQEMENEVKHTWEYNSILEIEYIQQNKKSKWINCLPRFGCTDRITLTHKQTNKNL